MWFLFYDCINTYYCTNMKYFINRLEDTIVVEIFQSAPGSVLEDVIVYSTCLDIFDIVTLLIKYFLITSTTFVYFWIIITYLLTNKLFGMIKYTNIDIKWDKETWLGLLLLSFSFPGDHFCTLCFWTALERLEVI